MGFSFPLGLLFAKIVAESGLPSPSMAGALPK
jgi:hypothetical protein